MRNPWHHDRDDVPADAGIRERAPRRRLYLLAVALWVLALLAVGALLLANPAPVDGGSASAEPAFAYIVADLDGPTRTIALDVVGARFGITIQTDPPAFHIVVADYELPVYPG